MALDAVSIAEAEQAGSLPSTTTNTTNHDTTTQPLHHHMDDTKPPPPIDNPMPPPALDEAPIIRRRRAPSGAMATQREAKRARTSAGRSSPHGLNMKSDQADLTPSKIITSNNAFRCPLAVYGCAFASFGSKNEWKRHVHIQHMRLGYWRCEQCGYGARGDRKPNDFNRKDLFIQHLRRMHPYAKNKPPAAVPTSQAESDKSEEQYLQNEATRCYRHLRSQPEASRCLFCPQRFLGQGSWDERMEHVGRHMEQARKDHVPPVPMEEWYPDPDAEAWFLNESIVERRDGKAVLADLTPTTSLSVSAPLLRQESPPHTPKTHKPPASRTSTDHLSRSLSAAQPPKPPRAKTASTNGLPNVQIDHLQRMPPDPRAQAHPLNGNPPLGNVMGWRPAAVAESHESKSYSLRHQPRYPVQEPPPTKQGKPEDDDGQAHWYLDCQVCGTRGKDLDDGKPTISCDKCETWQHGQCHGITLWQAAQPEFSFLCDRCLGKAPPHVNGVSTSQSENNTSSDRGRDTHITDAASHGIGDNTQKLPSLRDIVDDLLERVEDLDEQTRPQSQPEAPPANNSPQLSRWRSYDRPLSSDENEVHQKPGFDETVVSRRQGEDASRPLLPKPEQSYHRGSESVPPPQPATADGVGYRIIITEDGQRHKVPANIGHHFGQTRSGGESETGDKRPKTAPPDEEPSRQEGFTTPPETPCSEPTRSAATFNSLPVLAPHDPAGRGYNHQHPVQLPNFHQAFPPMEPPRNHMTNGHDVHRSPAPNGKHTQPNGLPHDFPQGPVYVDHVFLADVQRLRERVQMLEQRVLQPTERDRQPTERERHLEMVVEQYRKSLRCAVPPRNSLPAGPGAAPLASPPPHPIQTQMSPPYQTQQQSSPMHPTTKQSSPPHPTQDQASLPLPTQKQASPTHPTQKQSSPPQQPPQPQQSSPVPLAPAPAQPAESGH